MNLEKHHTQIEFTSLMSYAVIIGRSFFLWYNPGPDSLNAIVSNSLLIISEFVLVHSGLFMFTWGRIKPIFYFLVIFYLGLISVYYMASKDMTIFVSYCVIIVNRCRFLFYSQNEYLKASILKFSLFSAMIFLLITIPLFTFLSPQIPELGVSQEFLKSIRYYQFVKGSSGVLVDKPQLGLVWNILYFSSLIVLDIKLNLFQRGNK